eukprot:scaffold8684_cov112-Isochrysis_galbana.AAC.3
MVARGGHTVADGAGDASGRSHLVIAPLDHPSRASAACRSPHARARAVGGSTSSRRPCVGPLLILVSVLLPASCLSFLLLCRSGQSPRWHPSPGGGSAAPCATPLAHNGTSRRSVAARDL